MVSMFIIGSILAVAFPGAIVAAFVADRRRATSVVSDPSRFAAPALNPKLPWA